MFVNVLDVKGFWDPPILIFPTMGICSQRAPFGVKFDMAYKKMQWHWLSFAGAWSSCGAGVLGSGPGVQTEAWVIGFRFTLCGRVECALPTEPGSVPLMHSLAGHAQGAGL